MANTVQIVVDDETKEVIKQVATVQGTTVSKLAGDYLTKGLLSDFDKIDCTHQERQAAEVLLAEGRVESFGKAVVIARRYARALTKNPNLLDEVGIQ